MKPQTVIGKAKELIAQGGKEYAIKHFQDKLDEMGEPKDFGELCKQSGFLTAIKYIKGEI